MLEQAAEMAKRVGHIFVTTADKGMMPHLAVARKLSLKEKELVAIDEWYCPESVARFRTTHRVSVIIWDRNTNGGFKLLGETVNETGEVNNIPENELLITVHSSVDFTRFPQRYTEL